MTEINEEKALPILLNDDQMRMIARYVAREFLTVPKELEDFLAPGRTWWIDGSGLVKSNANYIRIGIDTVEEGFWIMLEVNNYRLWEYKFIYGREYRYPRTDARN